MPIVLQLIKYLEKNLLWFLKRMGNIFFLPQWWGVRHILFAVQNKSPPISRKKILFAFPTVCGIFFRLSQNIVSDVWEFVKFYLLFRTNPHLYPGRKYFLLPQGDGGYFSISHKI